MKRLIIADVKSYNNKGKSTGHYFAVAQNYLDLYSDCCEVKVAGGPIFKTHFNEKDIFLLPYDFIPSKSWLISKWRVLKNCKYIFKNTLTDDVIVIQQSGLSTAIMGIALFSKKKSNVYVIAYDTDAVTSPIKRLMYKFARHKIKGLLCPHKHVADAYAIPSCIITDYIYAKKNNNQPIIPFENRKYDIAIVGRICPGKGVQGATEYLINTNYKVIIAGKTVTKQQSDHLEEICKFSKNIELHIGFINDNDYYKYIRESRFCLLNYHGTYEDRSSGVVLDTIFNGTPILGHRCNALKFVEEEGVGFLYESINELKDVINKKLFDKFQLNIKKYLIKNEKYRYNAIKFLKLI